MASFQFSFHSAPCPSRYRVTWKSKTRESPISFLRNFIAFGPFEYGKPRATVFISGASDHLGLKTKIVYNVRRMSLVTVVIPMFVIFSVVIVLFILMSGAVPVMSIPIKMSFIFARMINMSFFVMPVSLPRRRMMSPVPVMGKRYARTYK